MPIHFPLTNRRQFLGSLGGGLITLQAHGFAEEAQEDLIYLLNDTHIGEKHPPDSSVPMNLKQVVRELTGLKQKPVATIINGDLALKDGQAGVPPYFLAGFSTAKDDFAVTENSRSKRRRKALFAWITEGWE